LVVQKRQDFSGFAFGALSEVEPASAGFCERAGARPACERAGAPLLQQGRVAIATWSPCILWWEE